MKLSDMNDAERNALGTLVRLIVALDGDYSPAESDRVKAAAAELGEDDFWQAIQAAGQQHQDDDVVTTQANAVERQEARETIYGVLFGIAAAESIVSREGHVLDQLATAWSLEPEITSSETE
ncbi:MAG: hypothetical protein AAF657_27545 [Acidobacteriota bacterium]